MIDIVDRVPVRPALGEAALLHHVAQIFEVVAAVHDDAADPRVVGIGAVILDVPGFVAESLEPAQVIHRLPGDAGQRHLADKMEEDDSAAFAHEGSGSELGVGAITCHTGLNFAEFLLCRPRRGVAPQSALQIPRTIRRHGLAPAARRVLGKATNRRSRFACGRVRPHIMRTRGEEPDIMTYVVTEACIRCKLMDCVEVCPVDCFYEGENMLVIHPDECIDCGVCEPECPVEAIKADSEPGLEKWLSLNAEYARIWPNITVKKAPPPDSKEWEGKSDKLQYFSPNPGAGD